MIFLSYLCVFFFGIIFTWSAIIIFTFYKNWDAGVYPELPPRKKRTQLSDDPASTAIIG